MRNIQIISLFICSLCIFTHAKIYGEELPQPAEVILAEGETEKNRGEEILAARRYAAFWNTGEPKYAEAALADNFIDRTLPEGREQGKKGPIMASEGFRKIVPDLKAEIEKMIVAKDYVVVQLVFKGHFTGEFKGSKGSGQEINFRGTDIYKIKNGKITDNWHIEDNLQFMNQIGAIKS